MTVKHLKRDHTVGVNRDRLTCLDRGRVNLLVEVDENYYDSRKHDVDENVERFFSSFVRPEFFEETQEALKLELIEHFPALAKTLEDGDARASYEAVYAPRDYEPSEEAIAEFRERVLRLISAFKEFEPDRAEIIGHFGRVMFGEVFNPSKLHFASKSIGL